MIQTELFLIIIRFKINVFYPIKSIKLVSRVYLHNTMTRKGHGIHPIELIKPIGIGMESWRRMKKLWKYHAPASVLLQYLGNKRVNRFVIKYEDINDSTRN